MVKTGQFTTKCNGDRVIALKRQISLYIYIFIHQIHLPLVGLRLER